MKFSKYLSYVKLQSTYSQHSIYLNLNNNNILNHNTIIITNTIISLMYFENIFL